MNMRKIISVVTGVVAACLGGGLQGPALQQANAAPIAGTAWTARPVPAAARTAAPAALGRAQARGA